MNPPIAINEPALKSERSSRLNVEDWAQAALDLIAEQGVGAVAVEALARRLGVTKGSFYWHFPSRDALLAAAVERWEKNEQAVYGRFETIQDPRERLRALFRLVAHEGWIHVIYSALLRASDHPIVAPVVNRVSQRRFDYLTQAFRRVGFDDVQAGHRARLTYAAYIGFLELRMQHARPRLHHDEYENYLIHVINTLIPAAETNS